ncbi:unnamed protein product, partial [Timema podura]|nr:unnamed protein product [Timema podura]
TKVSSSQQSVSRNSRESNERMVTSISLEMEISASSFQYGKVRLQCLATMFQLYRGEVEVVLEEERPRPASVLGTRETSVDVILATDWTTDEWEIGAGIAIGSTEVNGDLFFGYPENWQAYLTPFRYGIAYKIGPYCNPSRHCCEVARYLLVPATNGASIGVQQVARILNLVLSDAFWYGYPRIKTKN